MGKVFEAEPFRFLPGYSERLQEWAHEGNLSYFDLSQWIHEWFGEPECDSLHHDHATNTGTIEAACEFRSKLVRADNALWRIRDIALDRGDLATVAAVKPILSEIVEELEAINEYLWEV